MAYTCVRPQFREPLLLIPASSFTKPFLVLLYISFKIVLKLVSISRAFKVAKNSNTTMLNMIIAVVASHFPLVQECNFNYLRGNVCCRVIVG